MPNAFLQGIQSAFDNQAEIRNDVYAVASNWFVNRCPLVTRIPRVPVGSTTFTIVSRSFRPRIVSLAADALASDNVITLADASSLMNGDVLELASGERVELTGDPNVLNNTVPVRRGAEGSTPGAGTANDAVRLIGIRRVQTSKHRKAKPFFNLRFSAVSVKSVEGVVFPSYLCHFLPQRMVIR